MARLAGGRRRSGRYIGPGLSSLLVLHQPGLKAGCNYCRMEPLGGPPFVAVRNTNRD
jgi:hypothetical protein